MCSLGPGLYAVQRTVLLLYFLDQALSDKVGHDFLYKRRLLACCSSWQPILHDPLKSILSIGLTGQIIEYLTGDPNLIRRTFFHGYFLHDPFDFSNTFFFS